MNVFLRIYRIFLQILALPVLCSDFLASETGREYGVGFWKKCQLIVRMAWNNTQIISGSSFMEHIVMATSLLRLPKQTEGVVVECGTYKGVSAANLSLICEIIGRKLVIFDSFEGLPEPTGEDKGHALIGTREIHTYEKGSWCGALEEVRENIRQYGAVGVCEFNKGYFENTLPHFKEKCVQVFVDVDYRSSLETCVRYLWPLLQDNGCFYTHEAGHHEISSLFFSDKWWSEQLGLVPPGLIGAGTGLGLKIMTGASFGSSLGFTIKNPKTDQYQEVPQAGGMRLDWKAPIKLTSSDRKKAFQSQ